jgi:hypothetical protein
MFLWQERNFQAAWGEARLVWRHSSLPVPADTATGLFGSLESHVSPHVLFQYTQAVSIRCCVELTLIDRTQYGPYW